MRSDLLLPLLVTTVVATAGWFVVHRLNATRDLRNKLLELRLQYLLSVYRRLEMSLGRVITRSIADDVETALADLQLLGDNDLADRARSHVKNFGGKQLPGLQLGDLLTDLREAIRKDLGLKPLKGHVEHLRLHLHGEESSDQTEKT